MAFFIITINKKIKIIENKMSNKSNTVDSNIVNAEAIFVRKRIERETEKQVNLPRRYKPGLFRSALQARNYVAKVAKDLNESDKCNLNEDNNPWALASDVMAMTYNIHKENEQTDMFITELINGIEIILHGRIKDYLTYSEGDNMTLIVIFTNDILEIIVERDKNIVEKFAFNKESGQYLIK